MKKNLIILVTAVVLLGAFTLATVAHKAENRLEVQSATDQNVSRLTRDHSPVAGTADAKVTIVEFFDPACGTCRVFHPIVENILRDNPGKVKLVVRYMPLHTGSDEVVKILESARIQGKFWEALELAYATQNKWVRNHQAYPELFWKSIQPLGLDLQQVSNDMKSMEVSRAIWSDIEDGKSLGVDKTPGFFVNGKPLIKFGERPLLNLVNDALEREYGS